MLGFTVGGVQRRTDSMSVLITIPVVLCVLLLTVVGLGMVIVKWPISSDIHSHIVTPALPSRSSRMHDHTPKCSVAHYFDHVWANLLPHPHTQAHTNTLPTPVVAAISVEYLVESLLCLSRLQLSYSDALNQFENALQFIRLKL